MEADEALVVEVVSRRSRASPAPAEPGGTGLIGLAERVRWPAARSSTAPTGAGTSSCGRRCRGVIRVLLVDDDALVRSGLRMMLAGADRSRSWVRPTTAAGCSPRSTSIGPTSC